MSDPFLEFNAIFDNEEYIINIQTNPDYLYISIEKENEGLYWKKILDNKILKEITSQMGSYKSLKAFSDMLIQALSKNNENLSMNFCSLSEIQKLSGANDHIITKDNNIKKYLMMIYTGFEKVVYPIQMDYYGNNPDKELLIRTILRLKNKIKDLQKIKNNNLLPVINNINNNSLNNTNNNNNISYNNINNIYYELEGLKKENENLMTKIKLLENDRQLGAVENDDIYRNFSELQEKYNKYKNSSEYKINQLMNVIEELKNEKFKESQNKNQEKNKHKDKVSDLEKKLELSSNMMINEKRQCLKYIEERDKEIESLQRENRLLKEAQRSYKVKISNLEKELEHEKKETNYYKSGKYSSSRKSSSKKSYHSATCSYTSSFPSSFSKKTTTSFLKKNLIPNIYKNSYQRRKNYSPFAHSKSKKSNDNYSYGKSKSRSGSKKSSAGSVNSKGSKNKNIYLRNYKSPYKYEPTKSNNSNRNYYKKPSPSNSNYEYKKQPPSNKIKNLKGNSSKNIYNKGGSYYQYNNYIKNNTNNDVQNISRNTKKINNLSNTFNIADRLTRIQNLINQASTK